jgi:Zn-finger nucleic acid-binding protein
MGPKLKFCDDDFQEVPKYVPDQFGTCPVCKESWDDGNILDRLMEIPQYRSKSVAWMRTLVQNRYGRMDARATKLISVYGRDGHLVMYRCPFCKTEWEV